MIKYPEYDRSILSVTSSVLNHFGVKDCPHKSLPEFEELKYFKPSEIDIDMISPPLRLTIQKYIEDKTQK